MDRQLDKNHDGIVFPPKQFYLKAGTLIPALMFISVCFLLPLIFAASGVLSTDAGKNGMLHDIFTSPYYRKITGFTFFQAAASTFFAVAAGLPGGIILGRYSFRGKRIIHAFTAIPFVLPSIVVVLGFVLVYGNSGAVNKLLVQTFDLGKPPLKILYTKWAIILAHGFYNFPLTIRYVSSYVSGMAGDQEEAAALLGAGKIRQFFSVTLPRIIPSVLSAASIIFIFCFLSFALILVLGGGPKTTTLEVEVFRHARIDIDFAGAAVLGSASTFFTLIVTWLYTRLQRITALQEHGGASGETRRIRRTAGSIALRAYLALIAVFALAPLCAIFINSLVIRTGYTDGSVFGFTAWRKMFTGANTILSLKSAANSIITATAASGIAAVLGLALSYNIRHSRIIKTELVETLLMMPMGISSILLTLGYLSFKSMFHMDRRWNMLLIILAHSVIAYPFVLRGIVTAYRKLPDSVFEAASLLGAGPLSRFVSVELPLLKKALTASAVFAFAVSMGEINATLMLSEGRFVTIPLAVYRLIGSYNYAGASVLGVVLIITGVAAFYTMDTIGETDGT